MGANTFATVAKGKTAKEAFAEALVDARHEYGHGGYTGSIAEKHEFVMINPERDGEVVGDWEEQDYHAYAQKLIYNEDPRIDDKWGPAGCIDLGAVSEGAWLFFGWASS